MVCGQVPILASGCPQFLSNPLPLLVNGYIIFRFLFILWMALRLRFSISITREREVTGKARGWQTVYISPHLSELPTFKYIAFKSEGC